MNRSLTFETLQHSLIERGHLLAPIRSAWPSAQQMPYPCTTQIPINSGLKDRWIRSPVRRIHCHLTELQLNPPRQPLHRQPFPPIIVREKVVIVTVHTDWQSIPAHISTYRSFEKKKLTARPPDFCNSTCPHKRSQQVLSPPSSLPSARHARQSQRDSEHTPAPPTLCHP